MLLNVTVDEQTIDLTVPDALLQQAQAFFERMDQDMDAGWQMSRDWVDNPNREQRCQIAADKLLTALENENRKLAVMMAGYILARLPGVSSVDIDTTGEIGNTRFTLHEAPETPAPSAQPAGPPGEMGKMEALRQAAQDVTKVFKVGRNYRFSVFDHASGEWRDSAAVADKQEADKLREQAYKRRFEELIGRSSS
jgi:hypothetical protein